MPFAPRGYKPGELLTAAQMNDPANVLITAPQSLPAAPTPVDATSPATVLAAAAVVAGRSERVSRRTLLGLHLFGRT